MPASHKLQKSPAQLPDHPLKSPPPSPRHRSIARRLIAKGFPARQPARRPHVPQVALNLTGWREQTKRCPRCREELDVRKVPVPVLEADRIKRFAPRRTCYPRPAGTCQLAKISGGRVKRRATRRAATARRE